MAVEQQATRTQPQPHPPATQPTSSTPRPMQLLHVYEIIGISQFDPSKPEAVNLRSRRDWIIAAHGPDDDTSEEEDAVVTPFYWVRGRFVYEDDHSGPDGLGADFDGQGWVAEADLVDTMLRLTSWGAAQMPLLRGMLSFCCSMMISTIDRGRAKGMGRDRHLAAVELVNKFAEAAQEAAAAAHSTELGCDREVHTDPISAAEQMHMHEALAQAEYVIRATAASERAAQLAAKRADKRAKKRAARRAAYRAMIRNDDFQFSI